MDAENRNQAESLPLIASSMKANHALGQEPVDGLAWASDDVAPKSRRPAEDLTIAQYVATTFLPEHVAGKTTPGRQHYRAILKYVLVPGEVDLMFGLGAAGSRRKLQKDPQWPYLSTVQLHSTRPEHVQELISAAIERGYSSQTIRHIRNVVGAIFSHAIKNRHYSGENPVTTVNSPHMMRRESHSLSLDQTLSALELMRYPEREIALMAILTPMNIAEICGLQWRFVNLSDHFLTRNGQVIAPRTIAIRNQCYRGQLCSVPASRSRDVPILPLLLTVLRHISSSGNHTWTDFVFSNKAGRPINQINLAARRLKQIGRLLDLPWMSWQVLRRTRANLLEEYGTKVQDHLAKVVLPNRSAPGPSLVRNPPPHDPS
jgi:integrase